CHIFIRGSLARKCLPWNLDDNTEVHIERGEALNTLSMRVAIREFDSNLKQIASFEEHRKCLINSQSNGA
ncbi:hypothetical protein H5410_014792, partial [Solanum commersonii]